MNSIELKVARVRKGKSRGDIARLIGKSRNAYAKKESGGSAFTDEEKLAIAEELDLTAEQFDDIFFDGKLPKR